MVPVVGDGTVEEDEMFYVDLTIIDNGQFGISRGVGTILNDDTEPVLPDLAINDVQLVEGDSGTTAMVFTVTRSGDLSSRQRPTTQPPMVPPRPLTTTIWPPAERCLLLRTKI